MSYLLDTNIVSGILKDDRQTLAQLRITRRAGARVCISCITYYEIKRGLLYLDANRKLSKFEQFYSTVEVLLLDDLKIFETASLIHANLRRRGRSIQDADILIAATAIIHSLTLVSNDADLKSVQSLKLEDWL